MQKELQQLGNELKEERQARQITLHTIADRTKVNIEFLEAIEEGKFHFLPDPYPRHFLKLYLNQLGRNTGHFLNKYDSIINSYNKPVIVEKEFAKTNSNNGSSTFNSSIYNQFKKFKDRHSTVLVSVTILIILVIVILLIDNRNGSIATNNDSNTKNPTVVKQDSQLANFSPFILKKKRNLDLKLLAKERTWLQIVIDDSSSGEYVFEPGDTSVWQAKGKFQLRIGNGAGVRLYLNGNDLGEIGKQMEVVKLILTKDGVQRNKF